jgi:mannose-1-phosphate guanylyltransferase
MDRADAVHGVLQAGGRGSRMEAAGCAEPKPLCRVRGVPMVERLLRAMVRSGIRRVSVLTGFKGDLVERHLHGLADLPGDLRLECIRETRPRGNVGGLSDVDVQGERVLFSFADLVTDLDFTTLVDLHRRRGCDVTLASHHESIRMRLGELEVDRAEVLAYREKPEKRFLICSGIAVLERSVVECIDPDRPVGMSDLVTVAIARGHMVTHWEHGARWMDVNTPEELDQANRMLDAAETGP